VIRIFPNPESCLRLMRALTVEIHEDWIEQHRYLKTWSCSESTRN
jgi:putative transposase